MVVAISVLIIVILGIFYFIKKRKRGRNMPQGLQVFDEQGRIILDMTSSLTRVLGKFIPNSKEGHIDVPLQQGERLYAFYIMHKDIRFETFAYRIDGSRIYWQFKEPLKKTNGMELAVGDVTIVYGSF